MKRFIHIAAAVALLFGVSTAAQAQSVEEGYPYNFITVQGGVQSTFTNYDFKKLITPQGALSFGRYFNSKIGVRLHAQGLDIKGAKPYTDLDVKYKFKAITGDIDLLLNMTNILSPNRINDFFDWVLLGGFGVNYAWDFDEFKATNGQYYKEYRDCRPRTHNLRVGTQFNFNLSKHFAFGLEVDANNKSDEFNLKRNFNPDWQVAAFLGLTYKFGHPKKVAPVVYEEPVPEPVPEPKPEPKPVVEPEPKPQPVVVKDEPLKETFFYNIRLSDPDPEITLNKIVAWCKKYPSKGITIKGYADKGTGNPKINEGYAKARAEKVAKALQEKGIAADRMVVSSYGDTIQPFEDNDRNRCVIVVGE